MPFDGTTKLFITGIDVSVLMTTATNTYVEVEFREILEASFLYELGQRGHEFIRDRNLFITHD